jgi:ribosomal protein S18 acetylase RimI-like enzyme
MLLFEKDFYKSIDYNTLYEMFCNMASTLNSDYIYDILVDTDSHVILYSIDNTFVDIKNCPCAIIYQTKKENNELNVYIMLIATSYKFRKYGYASLLIKEFIEYIKTKYLEKYTHIRILLDSIEESVSFYEHIGFEWTSDPKHQSEFKYTQSEYYSIIMTYNIYSDK